MKIILFFIFTSVIASGSVPLALDLERIKKDNNLPGLISAFYQGGKVKEIAAVGSRKIHERYKLTTNDKFHLGSCTKSMTATLAAIAVEKGLLTWDTKVSELVSFKTHYGYADITFDLLFTHRAGLAPFSVDGNWGDLWQIIRSELYPPRESRSLIALTQLSQKPFVTPREKYEYSNTSYMIGASILEELFDDSYENLLSEYIFKPLGMSSCGFGPTSNPSMRTALQPWGHYINDDGKIVSYHGDNPPAFNPAGGVHCNFNDWLKYLKIHLNALNGKYDLINKESFEKLHTAYPAANSNYTFGGWGITSRSWANGVTLTHGGSNTLNTARVWIAPNKNAIMLSATNIQNYKSMSDAIVNLINRNIPLHIEVKNNSPKEIEVKNMLLMLLETYRDKIFKYMYTRKVVIETGVISHSHPITLNTKYFNEPNLLLSVFLHEQFHHSLDNKKEELEKFIKWTQIQYPTVPVYPNGGARNEYSTRLHILVNALELNALSDLIGEENAKSEIAKFSHYKWIYDTVLKDIKLINNKIEEFKL